MRVFGRESVRGLAAYFSSLVHESVRGEVLTAARHQSFIASHLLGGLLALCVFPIYLVVSGKPSLLSAAAFLWLLSPIGIAIFLSRTGKFAAAHLASAANFAGLVTYCAWLTGGLSSWLIPWMVAVPLEAALATDRRIVAWAAGVAGLGLTILGLGEWFGYMQAPHALSLSPILLAFIGAMTATAYCAALAVMVQLVHKRSETAIRAGEERYRLLAENATDMITRHDEKGRVVFASLGAQQLFGEPAQKMIGDGLFERVHVADRPAYLTALSRCHANGEPIAVEFRVRRAGAAGPARYVWVEMRCRPMRPQDTTAVERPSIVAVTRDVSDRKAQEAELTRTRDEAESASRAKTQFLANMSHELRTPLNAVIGFSEILNRELFGALGEARYRDYARLIHESGEHLLNVVNDILDMSKIEAGKFKIVKEPFEVASLVKSCCELMRHTAEQRSLSLIVDVAPGIPELPADKRACKQMLLNVISNAIKFTDPGGWVRVSARVEGESVELAVADNGIGIAEADLPKLGNPFVQANNSYDRSYDGAGLGLSVVKGLARLHGGQLELASTLGQGTTAAILLPLDSPSESVEALLQTPTVSAA
ncbi:MAG TPA: PAS domain-containing sensor histidine kinase [Rhizobiales bacterium]|nr:PAS domain-containing sensor histidine kinase [Hyphomicrobiales bacterium]